MSQKIFKKFSAKDYLGINGEISAIEDADQYFNDCLNYESAISDNIRGRVGCQAAAGPGYFFGLFPYNYTRTTDQYDITYDNAGTITGTKTTADGATMSKVIAINQQCWVLDTMNIVITQTNAGAYTWYTTVGTNVINFVILKDGSQILSTSLGNGISSYTTIYSLLGTIDALADLAIARGTRGTCPPFAIVNGAQTTALVAGSTYGNTYSVTVSNTPHNFYPGDIICFPQCTISGGTLNGVTTMAAGIVRTRTATVITYMGPKVTVTDGLVLGYMGQSAAGFPIAAISAESGGVFTLSIPYWRYIPEGPNTEFSTTAGSTDYGHIFSEAMYLARNKTASSFFAPPSSVSNDNNLYIATSTRRPYVEQAFAENPSVTTIPLNNGVTGALIKCDGYQLYRTGLRKAKLTVGAVAGATLTGTYKYKVFARRYDSKGNIWDGPVSDVYSITYAAPNQTGNILIALPNNNGTVLQAFDYIADPFAAYAERSAWKDTLQASNTAGGFRIDDSAGGFPYFQVGDVCCYLDNTAQTAGLTDAIAVGVLGTLHVTRCTFIDGSGANFRMSVADGSAATILDNTQISSGLTLVVLRTTSGGNQYYYLCEVPISSYRAAAGYNASLTDNCTDATLSAKAQYIEIPIGKEHDPPPNCSIVCQHQGGLVVSRQFSYPNTVSFSTVDGAEYFPVASNSFDVPSTISGHVSAIASDTDDRLAVFKSRAYYDVVGDLDGGVFSVNVRNEGDYGIASHASLVRIRDSLIGCSLNGYVAIKDGNLNHALFKALNAKLISQNYIFQWATAVNDSFMRSYVCTIPLSAVAAFGHSIEYDQENLRTFERQYANQVDPAAGACMSGDTLYHLSQQSPYGVFRRLDRFQGGQTGGGNSDSFIDNTEAIYYEFKARPICLGEPAQYKTPIRLRIFSLPNEGVIDGWVNFSYTVYTAPSWSGTFYGPTNTVTFSLVSSAPPPFKDIQLLNVKTYFYLVRMDTYAIRTSPFLTAYEIEFALDYDKEDFMP